MKKNKIAISKYSGAGNDFIIIDLRNQKIGLSRSQRKNLARKLCNRNFGIGADGLIFLEKPKHTKNKFAWDFYNQDGSIAEMCLNASRCVTLFEFHKTKKTHTVSFESAIGVVSGKVVAGASSPALVEVTIPLQQARGKKISLLVSGHKHIGYLVDSGVPHFVIHKKNFKQTTELLLAAHLRSHAKLKPRGANITYWEKKGKIIRAATFERGVENFTLACGTGAAAIGIMFEDLFDQPQVSVQMPGGKIFVCKKLDHILIKGPAQKIFDGNIDLKDIV